MSSATLTRQSLTPTQFAPGAAAAWPLTRVQAYACSDDRYPASVAQITLPQSTPLCRDSYEQLLAAAADPDVARRRALVLLRQSLEAVEHTQDDLPAHPEGLAEWMVSSAARATGAYQEYLAQRHGGAPRRFFTNRAHALYFLQAVAPTKLVDGAWLYGTLRHARDPRMAGLAQTYLEELGNGDVTKNHVLLYRSLLQAHGLGDGAHLDDACFEQGAIQLALGLTTEQMLPEVIGFNLGYEQLPLHLLITAYELNELGIDPYYFTLHVTVYNADSGHARKAVDAVALNASRYPDAAAFWRRVRQGYRLNDLGIGTNAVIQGFEVEREMLRILRAKSVAGAGAHSDYCRIDGKTVNQWLDEPTQMRAFIDALVRKGWIERGADPKHSRFWQLLSGDRAEMFGVFSDYELQVIFDWMRGEASADGTRFDAAVPPPGARLRPMSFRAQQRLQAARAAAGDSARAEAAGEGVPALDELSPSAHWTAEGLAATRELVATIRAA